MLQWYVSYVYSNMWEGTKKYQDRVDTPAKHLNQGGVSKEVMEGSW